VDKDGFIDRFDLETFLNRYKFSLGEGTASQQQISHSSQKSLPYGDVENYDSGNNFPVHSLTRAELSEVLSLLVKA
jgi:hypothetical protein